MTRRALFLVAAAFAAAWNGAADLDDAAARVR